MPLFGHKNRDDNVAPGAYDSNVDSTHTHNRLHRAAPDAGYDQTAPGAGVGTGMGMSPGTGHNTTALGHQGYNNNNNNAGAGGLDNRFDEPGMGSAGGIGPGGAAHTSMAPRTDDYGNAERPSGGSRIKGKAEAALGEIIGSSSLKQKGMEKQQESRALNAQAAELDIAEQHEQEALRRRERAVAHGAHPDHGFLGSNNPNRHQGGELGQGQGLGGANTGVGTGMNELDGPGRRGPGGAGPTGGTY